MKLFEVRGNSISQLMRSGGDLAYLSMKKENEDFSSTCKKAFEKAKVNFETEFKVVCKYVMLEEQSTKQESVEYGLLKCGDICEKIKAFEEGKHIVGVRVGLTCTSPVSSKVWNFILII